MVYMQQWQLDVIQKKNYQETLTVACSLLDAVRSPQRQSAGNRIIFKNSLL